MCLWRGERERVNVCVEGRESERARERIFVWPFDMYSEE